MLRDHDSLHGALTGGTVPVRTQPDGCRVLPFPARPPHARAAGVRTGSSAGGPDAPAEVTAAALRHAMGHFATGVTVITSVTADGQPAGTTANAVTSVSLDPPLVLVCLDRSSQTLAAISGHGAFAVNVLAAPQQHLSANFARRGLAADWDGVRHRPGRTGSPCLHEALATIECTVHRLVPGGDHEIVLGHVRRVATGAGDADPLLFWRGSYVTAARPPEPAGGPAGGAAV